jgi:hypothetical protein
MHVWDYTARCAYCKAERTPDTRDAVCFKRMAWVADKVGHYGM